MTFHDWIKLKGPQTLALAVGESYGTIRGWSSRNAIPRHIWPVIMIEYPEIGLRDLLNMEAASK